MRPPAYESAHFPQRICLNPERHRGVTLYLSCEYLPVARVVTYNVPSRYEVTIGEVMVPAATPITQYTAQTMSVRIDKVRAQAVITFIPHGQPPVRLRLPVAALDRFLVQASGELAIARSDAS
jgi:hypothetical protein